MSMAECKKRSVRDNNIPWWWTNLGSGIHANKDVDHCRVYKLSILENIDQYFDLRLIKFREIHLNDIVIRSTTPVSRG